MISRIFVSDDMPSLSWWFERVQIFFGFFCLVFLLSACGVVSTPSALKQMNGSFSHSGVTGNCAGCHDTGASFAAFPLSGHPDRKGQDCSSCHNVNSWKQGMVSHTPTPLECTSCHASAKPTTVVNQMYHLHPGLPDCVSCHAQSAGVVWSGASYSHSPSPTTCQDCHEQNRPSNHHVGEDCVGCHRPGNSWSN